MSGEALDEEADYGRLPFDIFVAVTFPNPLHCSVLICSNLTLARRSGGIIIIILPDTPESSGSDSYGNGRASRY